MFEAVLICGNTLFLAGLHEWTLSMKQQVWQARILWRNCTISKNKLLKSEQFQLVCLFLWSNMSYMTTFYSSGLGRYNILIFLCLLMGRSLPSATKLACCVTSLYRGHRHYPFSELCSHVWSYGGQIIAQITCYCSSFITSLILKGALRGKLLGHEHWEEQGGAAPSHRSHSTDTLGSHWRTPEMQLLHVMAFHTILVQTETTAQNTSQRSWVWAVLNPCLL